MPKDLAPMTASDAARLPTDDSAWAYELDWPGVRALASVAGGQLRLVVRGRDVSSKYPELRAIAEALAPVECALDGVVVAFDPTGQVSRAALQPRLDARDANAVKRLTGRSPVQYLAFDLLWLDGQSTMDLPYRQRRALLEDLGVEGPNWQTPPHFTGGGRFALDTARSQGLDGVVAKRLDSPYRSGEITGDWRKVPAKRR
jgi:bifunctional non-homologous end joining protein LigD